MAKNRDNNELNSEELERLRQLADKGSRMVHWYTHVNDGTIRGGYCRWFTCSEGSEKLPASIASVEDDTRFAAAAMNSFIPLLEKVDALKKEVEILRQYGNKDCTALADGVLARIPTIKWYNSKGEAMYLTKAEFDLVKKVHEYRDLPQEERMDTYRVLTEEELKSFREFL